MPVIVQGQHDPANAAAAIEGGYGDLISFARQMLADPDYARKATSGRAQEIVRCDRQNECVRCMIFGMEVRCSVNPRMGRESRTPGTRPPIRRFVEAPIEKDRAGPYRLEVPDGRSRPDDPEKDIADSSDDGGRLELYRHRHRADPAHPLNRAALLAPSRTAPFELQYQVSERPGAGS